MVSLNEIVTLVFQQSCASVWLFSRIFCKIDGTAKTNSVVAHLKNFVGTNICGIYLMLLSPLTGYVFGYICLSVFAITPKVLNVFDFFFVCG